MALSSVVAVGLPAGTADAATEIPSDQKIADKIESEYAGLGNDQKKILKAAQTVITEDLSIFIQSDYPNNTQLDSSLTKLIQPFSQTELSDLSVSSLARITTFRSEVGSFLSNDLEKEEVFAYAELLRSALYEGAKNSTLENLDPLYEEALDFYMKNPVPASAKDIIKKPTFEEVSTIIADIKKENGEIKIFSSE